MMINKMQQVHFNFNNILYCTVFCCIAWHYIIVLSFEKSFDNITYDTPTAVKEIMLNHTSNESV